MESARVASVVRWSSLAGIVLGLVLLARGLPLERVLGAVDALVRDSGAWGPLIFGAAYVLGALLLLPGSVLTLAAGALFGPLLGTVVVSLSSTTAATLAFLLGRHVARDAVEAAARRRPTFGAIDRAVGEGGWKVVVLLRLSPLVPFSIGNYLFGLTRVRFLPYVLASWAAMLPGTFLYVYLGHAGRTGLEAASGASRARTPAEWALLGAGFLATVVVTALLGRRARGALQERTEEAIQERTEEAMTPAPEETSPRPRPWRLRALATTAAVLLTAGILSACGAFQRFFGPPPVTLKEEYADAPNNGTFDHGSFDALLRAHVSDDLLVDYRGLQADTAALDRYLAQLARADLDALGRDERLALLINAYNAFTLRLILDHYPLASIRDIPSDQRWDGRKWDLGGRRFTLNELEHEQIRPNFREPRVHFALNCASMGCPPLRREAYVGARIEEQLEAQAQYVHSHPRWFRYDAASGVAQLTSLYDWYGGDFTQVAGSPLQFAARWSPALRADLEREREVDVRWLDYDWRLNEPGSPK